MATASAGVYRPRHPERSVLYRVVAQHFQRFMQEYDERVAPTRGPLPPGAQEAVNRYLDCGIFACGVARVRCGNCGRRSRLRRRDDGAPRGQPVLRAVVPRPEAAVWLNRQLERYERDGHGLWLVLDAPTRTPMGQVGLMLQLVEGVRRPEIGWLLHRPCWGQGYGTEAAAAVRDLARTRWHYDELISLIRPVNLPSRRVAERIGMRAGRHAHFHSFEHIVYSTSTGGTKPERDRR